jgi:hypothetical protein
MFAEFDASVLDIVGLTEYTPLKLPHWLRRRLDDGFCTPQGFTERDSVDRFVNEHLSTDWLGGWGVANVSGEEVFIFEYSDDEAFDFSDPAQAAERLECGLVFVEPSDRFEVGSTLFFTEDRQCVQRTGQCVGTLTQGDSWSDATTAALTI